MSDVTHYFSLDNRVELGENHYHDGTGWLHENGEVSLFPLPDLRIEHTNDGEVNIYHNGQRAW